MKRAERASDHREIVGLHSSMINRRPRRLIPAGACIVVWSCLSQRDAPVAGPVTRANARLDAPQRAQRDAAMAWVQASDVDVVRRAYTVLAAGGMDELEQCFAVARRSAPAAPDRGIHIHLSA